jgi:hypothetical protein
MRDAASFGRGTVRPISLRLYWFVASIGTQRLHYDGWKIAVLYDLFGFYVDDFGFVVVTHALDSWQVISLLFHGDTGEIFPRHGLAMKREKAGRGFQS